MPQKSPRFRGDIFFLGGGGRKCQVYFYGRRDLSEHKGVLALGFSATRPNQGN